MFITTAGGGMLAGGLLSALGGGGDEQTQTREMDPRLAGYVYGNGGSDRGLLGDTTALYRQQMQTGGLNSRQRQGLDMQMQYLTSPQYQQGNQAMYDTGRGLLGGSVAGNPFATGQARLGGRSSRQGMGSMQPMGGQQMGMQSMGGQSMGQPTGWAGQSPAQSQGGFQYAPMQAAPAADYSQQAPATPSVTQSDFETWLTEYLRRQAAESERYGNGTGSGSGGGYGGGGSVGVGANADGSVGSANQG